MHHIKERLMVASSVRSCSYHRATFKALHHGCSNESEKITAGEFCESSEPGPPSKKYNFVVTKETYASIQSYYDAVDDTHKSGTAR
jgi:hypothetical protein